MYFGHQERNGTGWTFLRLRTPRTEWNGTEWNENGTIGKKERERNNLAEGPRSRTEGNELKNRNMPSSRITQCVMETKNVIIQLHFLEL